MAAVKDLDAGAAVGGLVDAKADLGRVDQRRSRCGRESIGWSMVEASRIMRVFLASRED